MASTSKPYFSPLDGLRFLAFFSVFVSHSVILFPFIQKSETFAALKEIFIARGEIGVEFFFVLSGFLITYLLLKEKKERGGINLGYFYMRRILRIWPVYFIVLAYGFGLIPYLLSGAYNGGTELYRLPWYIAFLGNFQSISGGVANFAIAILWSVSVEEQFYLVWPLFLKVIPEKRLPWLFAYLVLASCVFRGFYFQNMPMLRGSTFSFISDLTIGGWTAYLLFYNAAFASKIKALGRRWTVFFMAIVAIMLPVEYCLRLSFVGSVFSPLIFSLAFACIVARESAGVKPLFSGLVSRAFNGLGKISYGLYCYHAAVLVTLASIVNNYKTELGFERHMLSISFAESIIALALTIAVSRLSFSFIEKPILRLKERFT